MTEKLPIRTIVRYHGSDRRYHGNYEITAYSDFNHRPAIFTPECIAEFFPDGFGYDLWPVGVPKKFGMRHLSLHFVRPESVTPLGDQASSK